MSKVIKSGKLDNVIASMDAGKHYIVKMRDGTVTAIEKTGLPEKIRVCLGNGCFIAGTLVTTKSGLKPIEKIVIGDYVLSRNEETGEDSYKKVTDTLVRSTQEICTIELETGKIKSTTGHLFMVKDKWWKAAVELVAGDILLTSDGKEQVVKSIKVEEKGYPVTTYNLTVEDNHTFFVGSEKILTHNTTKLLKKCDYTKEISESIIDGVENPTIKEIISERVNGLDLSEHQLTSKQLSSKKMSEIKSKIDNRTASKSEYEIYEWNKRFSARRREGVKQFWNQERERIINSENTTRNWTTEQIQDILNGRTPKYGGKPIQGHHSYSASKYPHLANKGEVIYPVTPNEHLRGWHGGNFKNSIPGEPIIDIKDF